MLTATAERMFRLAHYRTVKRFDGIPGPKPTFPFGTTLDFAVFDKQPWEICAEYGREHGGMTLIWLGGKPALVLNDPVLIGEVLERNWQSFYKDDPHKALLPIITKNSAFLANPPQWAATRAAEPLTRMDDWVPTQVDPMRRVLERHLDKLRNSGRTFDLLDTWQRMTFDAFNVAVCGVDLGDDAYADFVKMGQVGTRRMTSLLPIPTYPFGSDFQGAHERWFARFDALVNEARQNPDPNRTDLLSTLLRRGVPQEGTVLRDGIANISYGGVFSATSGVVTALYLLAAHPKVAARLAEELKQPVESFVHQEGRENRSFLDCVLLETLRYYSPVPLYFRNVLKSKSVKLGRHEIPPDTMIFITNRLIHRAAQHWKNPDVFAPERWHGADGVTDELHSPHFFPFGRGERRCGGAHFAMLYMKLALATALTHAEIDIDPTQRYQQGFFFGVMMPQDLKARVS